MKNRKYCTVDPESEVSACQGPTPVYLRLVVLRDGFDQCKKSTGAEVGGSSLFFPTFLGVGKFNFKVINETSANFANFSFR